MTVYSASVVDKEVLYIFLFDWSIPQALHGRGRYTQLWIAWCLGLLRSLRHCSLASPGGCCFFKKSPWSGRVVMDRYKRDPSASRYGIFSMSPFSSQFSATSWYSSVYAGPQVLVLGSDSPSWISSVVRQGEYWLCCCYIFLLPVSAYFNSKESFCIHGADLEYFLQMFDDPLETHFWITAD
jgi:hypothetical protein